MSDKANELLIDGHNYTAAIFWRFEQINKRAFKFVKPKGVHSVGLQESELRDKAFAAPLMRLKEPNYETRFLTLLGKSFEILKEDEQYYPYAQYIWEIVSAYFENLKERRSYEPLKRLEEYIDKHSFEIGMNWFGYKVKELKRSYLNFIGRPIKIAECIKEYNQLKSEQYLDMARPRDLIEKVKEVINSDLKKWASSEGIKLLQSKDEISVQKILKIQLENSFLRYGFRKNEVSILREPQLHSDKSVDFIISYGFVGPVILEVKLSCSSDLKGKLEAKNSYNSMKHYMDGYNAHYGIFLVVKGITCFTDQIWLKSLLTYEQIHQYSSVCD